MASLSNSPSTIAGSVQTFSETMPLYIYEGDAPLKSGSFGRKQGSFYKHDLSTAWNASNPAWTYFYTSTTEHEKAGTCVSNLDLSRDGSTLLLDLILKPIFPFNISSSTGMPTIDSMIDTGGTPYGFTLGDVTDPDSEIIYGITCFKPGECTVVKFDHSNGHRSSETPTLAARNPKAAMTSGTMVSSLKTIYYLHYLWNLWLKKPENKIYEYKIATNSLVALVTRDVTLTCVPPDI